MAISVIIPDELAEKLTQTAKAAGKTAEEVALSAIRRDLASLSRLDELMAPVYEAFEASGMTEDEAVELFEAEKHALRRERAAAEK